MAAPFDKHTFLVVDDEAFSRSMVQQMLKRAGALEVITAADGHEAISVLNKLPVSVMITDFHMPGLHGLQLLKYVRAGRTKAPRNLICAMLTGHAVRHLVGLAIVLDVDSFLAKPVSPETLSKHLLRTFQYRFDPLPAESYERIDVAGADVFLTGRVAPEQLPVQTEEDELAEPFALDEKHMIRPETATPADEPPPAPVERAAPPPRKAEPPPSKPKAKPATSKPTRDSAPASGPAKAPAKPKGEAIRVALKDVPENAMLARNIVGSSGTLLLAAGTPFRSRYIRRLQELADLEGDIEHVWITPP